MTSPNSETPVRIKVKHRAKDNPLRFTNLSEVTKLDKKYTHDPLITGFFDRIDENPEKFTVACTNIGKNAVKYDQYKNNPRSLRGRFTVLKRFNKRKNPELVEKVDRCERIVMKTAYGQEKKKPSKSTQK